MKCTVCGKENVAGVNYCVACGSKLAAEAAQVRVNQAYTDQGYAQQMYPQMQFSMAGAGGGAVAVQAGYPQQGYVQPVTVVAKSNTSGLAVASLVFGILTVITSFLLIGLGLINALLAIGFGIPGIISCKRNHKAGMGLAIAGLVMGLFGLILVIIKIAKGVALFNFVKDSATSAAKSAVKFLH